MIAGLLPVIILGIHVTDRPFVTSLDARIWLHVVENYGGHKALARHITMIGGLEGLLLISFTMAAVMFWNARWRGVALAIVAPTLATSITEYVLKPWINNAPWGVNTFPSGHATAAFSMAFVAVILVIGPSTPVRRVPLRWTIAFVAVSVATAVAIALVVAGFHFATDTVGAAGTALAVVTACALAIDAISESAWLRRRLHVREVLDARR